MAKKDANGAQQTKVILGRTPSEVQSKDDMVRLSYVHVFEPYAQKNDDGTLGEASYSTMLLIPKSDKKGIAALRAAEKVALEQGRSSKFGGKIPANPSSIIHDCDEEDDLEEHPEREGCYRMSVTAYSKPGVVDQYVQPILDSTEVYSGCYARVSLNAFPYNTKGKKGVSFGLNHVQKLADGEFLGGRSRAEDDFDEVEVDEENLI